MTPLSTVFRFFKKNSSFEKVRECLEIESGYDPKLWQEIADLGWLGIAIPENYGGAGMSVPDIVPVVESMGRFLHTSPFLATTLAGQFLLKAVNETQKKRWLPKLASGKSIGTVALMEPEGSWEPEQITASAEMTAQGYRLNGVKTFVWDAQNADMILGTFQMEGEPAFFLIESDRLDPSAFHRDILIDETRRSSRIHFDRLDVPSDALLSINNSRGALKDLHALAILLLCAEMTGGANGVMELTLDYLKVRKQFGKLIGSYQALKHPMVDIMMGVENTKSHLYYAATIFEGMQGESEIALRMTKAQAGETYTYAADRAVQFHGAMGFTYECNAQLFFRRAQWSHYSFGDSRHHRRHLANLLIQ